MNLNRFIIGCAQSDPNYGINNNNSFEKVLIDAQRVGFKYFDTSGSYKNSDLYIKNNLNYKNNLISKIKCEANYDSNFKSFVEKEVKDIFEKNKADKIYGILIHDPLLPLHNKKWKIVKEVLLSYKRNGYIKKFGVSVYSIYELENILKIFTPDIVQFPVNVFNQSFFEENLLKKLKKKNIELHARSIFLQGLLLKKKSQFNKSFKLWNNNLKKWQLFLKKNKLDNLTACLSFVLNNKNVDKIIIGLDSTTQLKSFLRSYNKIIFNKKKIFNFDQLKVDEVILNDPRYWSLIKNKENINYEKWLKVKENILNGSLLLSKKPNQYLPGGWPTFYKRSKKCFVWDNSNKKYLDFSLMGIGTNILGYSNNRINKKVIDCLNNGNSSTLNSNFDYELSKKLLKIHPWAKVATFARTGGEINAVAVRVARAYSKKDEVAICGYHGWHDWYISTNLTNKNNLNKIHLPGLSTIGIPKKLGGLIHPFKFNDLKSFKKIINKNNKIGLVVMEVQRNEKPKKKFLSEIRNITKKKNIVLIFDECTSGFRETYGGIHKKYKIEPDMAVFGKSLGNGVPITALIGKKHIMDAGKESFISSTFWTDSMGPVSAIATLNEMKRIKSWKKIKGIGIIIKNYWKKFSKKYNIKIIISGLDALPTFKFDYEIDLYLRTYLTQEMLKKNILATNTVYCCIDHKKYLKNYLKELEKIFYKISIILKEGNLYKHLNYPVVTPGFSRLN
jgi:glutamate-1-semialdehyde 2,1-aminomutase